MRFPPIIQHTSCRFPRVLRTVTLLAAALSPGALRADVLLSNDLNTASTRPTLSGYASSTAITSVTGYSNDGTIDTYQANTNQTPAPSAAAYVTADFTNAPVSAWQAGLKFNRILLGGTANTGWDAKFNLSFDLSVNKVFPIRVRVTSYSAATGGSPTGQRTTVIYPPVVNAYYRYSLNMNDLTTSLGSLSLTGPYIELSVEFDSSTVQSWPHESGNTVRVDNLTYSTPKYFVDGAKPDGGNGQSEATAFNTLGDAAAVVQPGDTVMVMNTSAQSTLTNAATAGTVASFQGKSGSPARWITVRAYPGQTPLIKFNTWQAIYVGLGSAYLEFNGLKIVGALDDPGVNNLTNAEADAVASSSSGLYNGNGFSIIGRSPKVGSSPADETIDANRFRTDRPHHIRVIGCNVSACTSAGIGAIQSDYLTFADNTVERNSWLTKYGSSGISILDAARFDNLTTTKQFVLNNYVDDNRTKIKCRVGTTRKFTDGNGIIIDDSRNVQVGSLGVPPGGVDNSASYQYLGRFLVQNNVAFNNGGGGIHVWRSASVDVTNNSTYGNSSAKNSDGSELNYAEIDAARSDYCRIYNNVMYALPGKHITSWANYANDGSPTNVSFQYNVYWPNDGSNIVSVSSTDVIGNPLYVNPGTGNLQLSNTTSPAYNTGVTGSLIRQTDIDGIARPRNGAMDRGAYEY